MRRNFLETPLIEFRGTPLVLRVGTISSFMRLAGTCEPPHRGCWALRLAQLALAAADILALTSSAKAGSAAIRSIRF